LLITAPAAPVNHKSSSRYQNTSGFGVGESTDFERDEAIAEKVTGQSQRNPSGPRPSSAGPRVRGQSSVSAGGLNDPQLSRSINSSGRSGSTSRRSVSTGRGDRAAVAAIEQADQRAANDRGAVKRRNSFSGLGQMAVVNAVANGHQLSYNAGGGGMRGSSVSTMSRGAASMRWILTI
jgi:hypothetical protein